jgi:succinate dehydrogenase/fumarate reductase flavoprotein subunit
LIAKDVNGLMMAGRCISGDFFAHASYRVTGNAVAMGEAAGKVAAQAALEDKLPQKIKYKSVSE